MKKIIVSLIVGFGIGFSFSSYQVAKEKQSEEQVKVDYWNRCSTRFLTLKNGNNYTDELLGKYVTICRDHYYQLREYYRNQENKLSKWYLYKSINFWILDLWIYWKLHRTNIDLKNLC